MKHITDGKDLSRKLETFLPIMGMNSKALLLRPSPATLELFLLCKIAGFKRLFPVGPRVDKEININQERVKVFSPEMDFFTSSTVMPQRDLMGQVYFLSSPLVIFKEFISYMVSQERKR